MNWAVFWDIGRSSGRAGLVTPYPWSFGFKACRQANDTAERSASRSDGAAVGVDAAAQVTPRAAPSQSPAYAIVDSSAGTVTRQGPAGSLRRNPVGRRRLPV